MVLVLLPVLFLQLYFSFHQWTVYLGTWWDAEFVGLELFWEVLTDPTLLPELTPYLHRIDVDGKRWTWNLTHIPVMSATVAPTLKKIGGESTLPTVSDPIALRLKLGSAYPDRRLGRDVTYSVTGSPLGFGLMYIAGVVSGLLGIGSGALKVLAMDTAMRLPIKVSTATSNYMIGVTAAASAGIYFWRGDVLPLVAAPVALGPLAIGSLAVDAFPLGPLAGGPVAVPLVASPLPLEPLALGPLALDPFPFAVVTVVGPQQGRDGQQPGGGGQEELAATGGFHGEPLSSSILRVPGGRAGRARSVPPGSRATSAACDL